MAHQILPGSLEQDGTFITAGVHTGPAEFQIENLRYIQGDLTTGKPGETLLEFLGRIYDNSSGDLIAGDFQLEAPE